MPRVRQPIKDKALHGWKAGRAASTGWSPSERSSESSGSHVQPLVYNRGPRGGRRSVGLCPLLPLLMAEFAMTVASLHWSALETE